MEALSGGWRTVQLFRSGLGRGEPMSGQGPGRLSGLWFGPLGRNRQDAAQRAGREAEGAECGGASCWVVLS